MLQFCRCEAKWNASQIRRKRIFEKKLVREATFPRMRQSTFPVPTATHFFDDVQGVAGVGVPSPTHP